ncbi:MAG: TRAP transporter large permease subunit, partial [Rhodocyclaceae bacterium]|nr:TRAP transporter large permease subunit [Rhodocyclaceae bacterium]
VNGWSNAARVMGQVPFDSGSSYTLSQLPLFVLMGDLAVRSGMSGRLYSSAQTMFSGLRGSQAFATLGASAGFGAVSGSSIATAATMTRVALPSMRSARYDDRLSVGSVAAGGTLGILIPPSIALVVYGMIAEQSVPRLYAASLLPGILLFAIYVVIVALLTAFKSGMAPKEALRASLGQRVRALANVWEITLLFVVVIGGIYTGMLSATEAAAVGAAGAFLLGFLQRKLTLRD